MLGHGPRRSTGFLPVVTLTGGKTMMTMELHGNPTNARCTITLYRFLRTLLPMFVGAVPSRHRLRRARTIPAASEEEWPAAAHRHAPSIKSLDVIQQNPDAWVVSVAARRVGIGRYRRKRPTAVARPPGAPFVPLLEQIRSDQLGDGGFDAEGPPTPGEPLQLEGFGGHGCRWRQSGRGAPEEIPHGRRHRPDRFLPRRCTGAERHGQWPFRPGGARWPRPQPEITMIPGNATRPARYPRPKPGRAGRRVPLQLRCARQPAEQWLHFRRGALRTCSAGGSAA